VPSTFKKSSEKRFSFHGETDGRKCVFLSIDSKKESKLVVVVVVVRRWLTVGGRSSRARFRNLLRTYPPSPAEEIYGKVDSVTKRTDALFNIQQSHHGSSTTWGNIPSEITKEEEEKRCIALPRRNSEFFCFPSAAGKGRDFYGVWLVECACIRGSSTPSLTTWYPSFGLVKELLYRVGKLARMLCLKLVI